MGGQEQGLLGKGGGPLLSHHGGGGDDVLWRRDIGPDGRCCDDNDVSGRRRLPRAARIDAAHRGGRGDRGAVERGGVARPRLRAVRSLVTEAQWLDGRMHRLRLLLLALVENKSIAIQLMHLADIV